MKCRLIRLNAGTIECRYDKAVMGKLNVCEAPQGTGAVTEYLAGHRCSDRVFGRNIMSGIVACTSRELVPVDSVLCMHGGQL